MAYQSDLNIDKLSVHGDIPVARFGHTLTLCSKSKAVLFGGAIGDSGKFIITNELYLIDFETNEWTKLNQQGNIPSQRAAHAACMVENNQIVVYGGAASGGGGLSSDDLFLLDMRNNPQSPQWIVIPTNGPTPGKRYGHTMVFNKPFLVVFGGNTGTQPVDDVWILNVEKAPYQWQKFQSEGPSPATRVYHAASLCQTGSATGMMVIYGGRTSDQSALNDCWGLRKHRDGKWDWVKAPYKNASSQENPICRYQHWITFQGSLMIVVGGRTNANEELQNSFEIYDTETSDWYRMQAINRYRHAILLLENNLFMYGGFEPEFPNKPLDSMLKLDLLSIAHMYPKLAKQFGNQKESNNGNVLRERNLNTNNSTSSFNGNNGINKFNANSSQKYLKNKENDTENYIKQEQQKQMQQQSQQQQLANQTFNGSNNSNVVHNMSLVQNSSQIKQQHQSFYQNENVQPSQQQIPYTQQNRSVTPLKSQSNAMMQKKIRLSNQAVVAQMYEQGQELRQYCQKVYVQNLAEESKKLVIGSQVQTNQMPQANENFCQIFIQSLLRPKEWKPNDLRLPFRRELILRLCEEMKQQLIQQDSLVRLRVPLKIFGSIHGRFNELLRFFDNFGSPCDDDMPNINGDIEKFDYLFLGNYCDRGFNSLEVLCLLFALKIKYPEQIHLLRGTHEDRNINKLFGLAEECHIRLNEDISDPNSVYQKINSVFDLMPLAALVEDKILCVHGGLGKKNEFIQEIENIERPIENLWDSNNTVANGLLWSNYVEQEIITHPNKQRDIFKSNQIHKFGDLKVKQFLSENKLNMIIRSNTPCQEGYDTNEDGSVITVFSCPDYGAKFSNAGACIKITKNFQIVPSVIVPSVARQGTWVQPESSLKTNIMFSEVELGLKKRPLTPPKRNLQA